MQKLFDGVTVHFEKQERKSGPVAMAELHFAEGPLAGLKLIGFSIWERESVQGGKNLYVTLPARQYRVNGEQRAFALLRPAVFTPGHNPQDDIRDSIREAYLAELEQEQHELQERR